MELAKSLLLAASQNVKYYYRRLDLLLPVAIVAIGLEKGKERKSGQLC